MGFAKKTREKLKKYEEKSKEAVDAILSNDELLNSGADIYEKITSEARKTNPHITSSYIKKHVMPIHQNALKAIKQGKTEHDLRSSGFSDIIIENAQKQHIRDVIDEVFDLSIHYDYGIKKRTRDKILAIISNNLEKNGSSLAEIIDSGDEKLVAEKVGVLLKPLVQKAVAELSGEQPEQIFKYDTITYYNGSSWRQMLPQEMVNDISAINLKINNLEEEVKTAQANLDSAKQRGTHNSCWGYPSPHLSNVCVQKYQNILQTKTKFKNKYADLQTRLEERLNILQEKEAELKAQEEARIKAENVILEAEEEEAARTVSEDIEIEVDLTGTVGDGVETEYEPTS